MTDEGDYCTQKICKKVYKSLKQTGLADFGMSFSDVLEILVSFCKDHPDEVKKWKEKNKQKFE